MRKYIALALTLTCVFSFFSCADTESSVRDSSCGTVTENTAEEISSELHADTFYTDENKTLTETEYFNILHENAAVNGFYCDSFGEAFDNADEITMDYFLAVWNNSEEVPLISQFAPELCYMTCGSGIPYYHFKIEGDFVLTFQSGIFHSISCMRDGEVVEFNPQETVCEFFEKYPEKA